MSFESKSIDTGAIFSPCIAQVTNAFSRLPDGDTDIGSVLIHSLSHKSLLRTTPMIVVLRQTGGEVVVRMLFDVTRGVWGSDDKIQCPQTTCSGHLVIARRSKMGSLAFMCSTCYIQSPNIPQPDFMVPTEGGMVSVEYPLPLVIRDYILSLWHSDRKSL